MIAIEPQYLLRSLKYPSTKRTPDPKSIQSAKQFLIQYLTNKLKKQKTFNFPFKKSLVNSSSSTANKLALIGRCLKMLSS